MGVLINQKPIAQNVPTNKESIAVDLSDSRISVVPVVWYPRLLHSSNAERNNWRVIAKGEGISWPELDEILVAKIWLLGNLREKVSIP